jgi:RNA polymerase-binding transcription factor DksA
MTSHSKLKAELELKLSELLAREAEIETELNEPGSSDWEEKAVEMENSEALTEVGKVTSQEIHEIKLAISRIESGHYGICSNCGKAISAERQSALPSTTTCIQCAARMER